MSTWRASAPGKVLIWGEYGVLLGAPALVMAVDRRAQVRLSESGQGRVHCDPSGDYEVSLRQQLKDALVRHGLDPASLNRLAVQVDSRSLHEEAPRDQRRPRKLGLGSSAAVLVALDEAVARWAQSPPMALVERLRCLQAGHQGGQGSGMDIAAALQGGVFAYRRGPDMVPALESLVWPSGLHWQVVWSGQPSVSSDHVARFLAATQQQPERAKGLLAQISAYSEGGLAAWRAGQWSDVLDAFDAAAECLGTIGDWLQRPLLSERDRHGQALARRCGAHYKPAGAGGGDIGLLLAADASALARASAALVEQGWVALPMALDPHGTQSSLCPELN